MSYLEDCLESDNNATVAELIECVTFEKHDLIYSIGTMPKERSPLNSEGEIVVNNCDDYYGYGINSDKCDSILHSQQNLFIWIIIWTLECFSIWKKKILKLKFNDLSYNLAIKFIL